MKWLKAATKTHSEAASSSQLAAAHPMARRVRDRSSHQDGEPLGQPLDQGGGPVGVEEADAAGHPADDPAGLLLAAGQEVEQAAEGAEQDHPDAGGHDDQDRGRLRLAAVVAGRGVEAVGDQEGHQRAARRSR